MSAEQLRDLAASICETAGTIDAKAGELTDPTDLALLLADVRDAKRNVAALYDTVEQLLVSVMGEKEMEVPGLGIIVCRKKTKRTGWHHDELLTDVLDTKLVCPDGEVIDETPLDKVKAVWGLRGYQARLEAIRSRGLDPAEYCLEEHDGYGIQLPKADSW